MSPRNVMLACTVAALCTACTRERVTRQLHDRLVSRGGAYADEVQAQSPFEAVTLSWPEAAEVMEERNPDLRDAVESFEEARQEAALVPRMAAQMQKSVKSTVGGVLDPKELARLAQRPVRQLPAHIESLASFKDFSHELEQEEWQRVSQLLEAKQKVRQALVGLYRHFKVYELLEQKREWLDGWQDNPVREPKFQKEIAAEFSRYDREREQWLDGVRDLFNAEYHDVRLVLEDEVMPMYRDVKNPRFENWERWRALPRSEEAVGKLKKEHQESKPTVPGTRLARNKLTAVLGFPEPAPGSVAAADDGLRAKVRGLLRNWHDLKRVQREISGIREDLRANREKRRRYLAEREEEADGEEPAGEEAPKGDEKPELPLSLQRETFGLKSRYFALREQEIDRASQLWLLDEDCWAPSPSGR